jgi:Kef-type K+ transport system membrane component KefB
MPGAMTFVLLPFSIAESTPAAGHGDYVAGVLLGLALILLAAKLGGECAISLKQPAVLGELVAGMVLGNLGLLGVSGFDHIRDDPSIDLLARLGVIVLLFEVGLESTVGGMLRVGWSSLLVAVIGVIVPFTAGWGIGAWLLPASSVYVHAFLGAALTATSVGITARVLKDLDAGQSGEAQVILGAAVIDDVLGLVLLAIVAGVITTADMGKPFSASVGLITLAKALLFLVGSLLLGVRLTPGLFGLASRLRSRGVLLTAGLSFCFLLSWLANAVGLAPIVGAFSAGLILENVHYKDFVERGEHSLEELVHPISSFLVPVFFVVMGMRTDLRAFVEPGVAGLAVALTVVAILGKQAAGLGVRIPNLDRVTVGLGMIPRGEVGLIFANIGRNLLIGGNPIITDPLFSAVVVMVVVTTMVTPIALRWRLTTTRLVRQAPK